MASFLRWFVLTALASLYGVVQAQCIIRTLVPMAMMDASCSTASACEDCTSADDLSALLLLARALEMDRANSANNGVDVNGLINNLLNALVYIATHNSVQSQGYAAQGFAVQGYSGQSYSGSSNNDVPLPPPPPGYTDPSGSKNKDNGLLNLQLLRPGKDNVLDAKLVGKTLAGIGIGGDGSDGGVLDGVTNTLGGVTGSSGGSGGLLGGVGNTVGGLLEGVGGLLGS